MWSEYDLYLLKVGKHTKLYEKMGSQVHGNETTFRVIAPNATNVELVCEHNEYQPLRLKKIDSHVWEIIIEEDLSGYKYKYLIHHFDYVQEKNDPFCFQCELRPHNSSIVTTINKIKKPKLKQYKNLNMFEMHLGGYKKNLTTYKAIAEDASKYIKEMNYNFVEIMPIMEHPQDVSWGYQVTNYYAPTSRYGSCNDFAEMVNIFQKNDIRVILDWVPSHFANDFYGLINFDGKPMFEYYHSYDAVNELWGTINFDFSSPIVRSFLLSNIFYYIEKYNVDGFRVDAVSNLIYWRGEHNGTINNSAIEFIKILNEHIKKVYPEVIMIAEDSSNYEGVTSILGFDYKWCLGWMHDSLKYFNASFDERKNLFHHLTFSFVYMFKEKYILPLSHDEVVHIKGSIVNKMYGTHEQKIEQLKVFYTFMFMHPGGKLNFMGNDLATYEEFGETKEIEWFLKGNEINQYFKTLGELYTNNKEFSIDENFEYILEHVDNGILIFKRGTYLIILNTNTNYVYEQHIYVNNNRTHHLVIDSKWQDFGGNNIKEIRNIKPSNKVIKYSVEPLSCVVLKEGICKVS